MCLGVAELHLVHATSVFAQACAMRGKRALLFVRQLGNRTATTVVVGFAIRLTRWRY